jgi:hypothetical protein
MDDARQQDGEKTTRLAISLAIFLLALASLVIMKLHADSYWLFTWVMAVIDAVLCVWLAYHKKKLFWSQVWQWCGFFAFMLMVSVFLQKQVITYDAAGLLALLLLSFSIFISGIYTEVLLMLVGAALAILVMGVTLVTHNFWFFIAPVSLVTVLILYWLAKKSKNKER